MADQRKITYTIGFNSDLSGLNKIKKSLQELQSYAGSNLNLFGDDFKKYDAALTEVKRQAGLVGDSLQRAFNPRLNTIDIDKFKRNLDGYGLELEEIYRTWGAIGPQGEASLVALTNEMTKLSNVTRQQHGFLDKMTRTLANTIRYQISTSFINNVSGAFKSAIGFTKTLDTSLNNIRIVTNKTADDMQRFADIANKSAKQLATSTTDYTNAALIYYQQGLGDQEVQQRTETTLKASNVTGMDTASMSDALTALWNGYQVALEDTELYVDKLAAVAANSASDLEELTTAMSKIAATANTVGVDVDSLTAQISTIVSVTRQAPESVGTALKTIYARLGDLKVDGVDEFGVALGSVSSQMEQMGINILDVSGNMRDMQDIITDTAEKWDTWTAAQKQAAAVAMAGKRQYTQLMALFENWNMYTEQLATAQGAAGTLDSQQNIYLDSIEAAQQQYTAAKEGLYRSIIDDSTIKGYYELLEKIYGWLDKISQSLGGLGGIIRTVGMYMAPIISNLGVEALSKWAFNLQQARMETNQIANQLKTISALQEVTPKDSATYEALEREKEFLDVRLKIGREWSAEETKTWNTIKDNIADADQKLILYKEDYEKLSQTQQMLVKTFAGTNVAKFDPEMRRPELTGDIEVDNLDTTIERVREVISDLKSVTTDTTVANLNEQIGGTFFQENTKLKEQELEINNAIAERETLLKKIVTQDKEITQEQLKQFNIDNDTLDLAKQKLMSQKMSIRGGQKGEQKEIDGTRKSIEQLNKDYSNGILKTREYTSAKKELEAKLGSLIAKQTEENVKAKEYQDTINNINKFQKGEMSVDEAGAFLEEYSQKYAEVKQEVDEYKEALETVRALQNEDGSLKRDATVQQLENAVQVLEEKKAALDVAMQAQQEKSLGVQMHNDMLGAAKFESTLKTVTTGMNSYVRSAGAATNITGMLRSGTFNLTSAFMSLAPLITNVSQNIKLLGQTSTAAMGALGIALSVAGAIYGAITGWVNASEEAEKKALEASIQSAGEHIDSNQELIDSYKQLSDGIASATSTLQELNAEFRNTNDINKYREALYNLYKDIDIGLATKLLTVNNDLDAQKYIDQFTSANNTNQIQSIKDTEQYYAQYFGQSLLKGVLSNEGMLFHLNPEIKAILNDIQSQSFEEIAKHRDEYRELAEDLLTNENQYESALGKELLMVLNDDKVKEAFSNFDSLSTLQAENLALSKGYTADSIKTLKEYEVAFEDVYKMASAFFDKDEDAEKFAKNFMQSLGASTGALSNFYEAFKELDGISLDDFDSYSQSQKLFITANIDTIKSLITGGEYSSLDALLADFNNIISTKDRAGLGLSISAAVKAEEIDTTTLDNLDSNDYFNSIGTTREDFEKLTTNQQKGALIKSYIEQIPVINKAVEETNAEIAEKAAVVAKEITDKYGEAFKKEIENIPDIMVGWEMWSGQDILKLLSKDTEELTEKEQKALEAFAEENPELAKNAQAYANKTKELELLNNQLIINSENTKKYSESEEAAREMVENYSKSIDTLQSSYESLKSIVEDYNSTGQLTLDNLQTLISMSPEYLAALEWEGNQMSINKQYLVDVIKMQLEETKAMYFAETQAGLLAIAEYEKGSAALEAGQFIVSAEGKITQALDEETRAALKNKDAWQEMLEKKMGADFGWSDAAKAYAEQRRKGQLALEEASSKISVSTLDSMAGKSSSGSKKDPKTEELKKLDQELDRYHDINIELKHISTELSKLQKYQDKLQGGALTKNLQEQLILMKRQIEAQKEKLNLNRQEAGELKGKLAGVGVNFNSDGSISNYDAIVTSKVNEYNLFIEAYNKMDAATQEANEKLKKQYDDNFKEFKDWISKYDTLISETIPNAESLIEETAMKELETKFKTFHVRLDAQLDINSLKSQWAEFIKTINNDDDYALKSELDLSLIPGKQTAVTDAMQAAKDAQAEWERILNDPTSTDAAKAIAQKSLADANTSLQKAITDLRAAEKAVQQDYKDSINAVKDGFKSLLNGYEQIDSQLNHDIKLMQLLYGDKAYSDMSAFYAQKVENDKSILAEAKQQLTYWEQKLASVAVDSPFYETFKQNYLDALNECNSALETALQNIKDKYTNAVNAAFKTIEDNLTDGLGFDNLSQIWSLQQEASDTYLDEVNRAYEVSKLQAKYTEAASKVSLNAQKKLNTTMAEQMKYLREKENLSKYDVERAQKLYDLAVAQAALEDARANKSQMRLKRDSRGNYSFEFMADDKSIIDAQQKVNSVQNDLYNFDKKALVSNFTDAQKIYQNYIESVKKIQLDESLGEEEKEAMITELNKNYEALRVANFEQYETIKRNIAASTEDAIALYAQKVNEEKLIPTWTKTMEDFQAKTSDWKKLYDIALGEIAKATEDYHQSNNDALDLTGTNLKTLKEDGYDPVLGTLGGLNEKQTDLNGILKAQEEQCYKNVLVLDRMTSAYSNNYNAAVQLAGGINEALLKQKEYDKYIEERPEDKNSVNDGSTSAPAPQAPIVNSASTVTTTNNGSSNNTTTTVTATPTTFLPAPSTTSTSYNYTYNRDYTPSSAQTAQSNAKGKIDVIYYTLPFTNTKVYALYDLQGHIIKRNSTGEVGYKTEQDADKASREFVKVFTGYTRNKLTAINGQTLKDAPVQVRGFNTGGYTGDWAGPEGRLAVLHKKELVLNAQDTENILSAVDIMRNVMSSLNGRVSALAAGTSFSTGTVDNNTSTNQSITINADFPNVSSADEIKEAFDTLSLYASQQAFNSSNVYNKTFS